MKKLISLSEFIDNLDYEADAEQEMNRLCVYHKFLKQPLTLGMFVPTDLEGNFLEEPRREYYDSMTGWNCPEDAYNYENKLSNYKEAENRVLFEGFKLKKENMISKENKTELFFDVYFDLDQPKLYDGKEMFLINTVEDLVNHSVELTESAIKQIAP